MAHPATHRKRVILALPPAEAGVVAAREQLARQLGVSPALVAFLCGLEGRIDQIEQQLDQIDAALAQLAQGGR